jgi:hypothetical protein
MAVARAERGTEGERGRARERASERARERDAHKIRTLVRTREAFQQAWK